MMNEPTAAQRLIESIERGCGLCGIEPTVKLVESLGGNGGVVRYNAANETLVLYYICALTIRRIEESQPAIHPRILFPLNEGHGHVFPRPDGVRMRCGGPDMCDICNADAFEKIGR